MWTTAVPSELATYLRREFAQRGWSQRRAALELGMSVSTLNNILNRPGREPTRMNLHKIAEGLRLPLRRVLELAGMAPGEAELDELALRGLSDDQRAFLRSLPPDKKSAVIDLVRRAIEGS